MSENKAYDVVCIGNYTKDTIVSPAGVTYVDGGAVNYCGPRRSPLRGQSRCGYPSRSRRYAGGG